MLFRSGANQFSSYQSSGCYNLIIGGRENRKDCLEKCIEKSIYFKIHFNQVTLKWAFVFIYIFSCVVFFLFFFFLKEVIFLSTLVACQG